jgi:hypothetical protein
MVATIKNGIFIILSDAELLLCRGCARHPRGLRGDLPGAGDEQAHEGSSRSRLRALCRSRVVAEMHQRRGTRLADHLKLVLSIMDRQVH